MRYKDEEGQAIVLVAFAMGIFLIGGVGLAVDGAHIYAQRQMAQAAADAAAQAGIMSIFDGTTGASGSGFSTSSAFNCSTTDTRTPCAYASKNGFGGTTSDTVTVDFPAATSYPGVAISTVDTVPLIRVNVQRSVNTTLMRLLGPTATNVQATATAAIVMVQAPTPILVTDPTNANTLSMNGTTSITICGGPTRSVEVNSRSSTAYGGGGTVDLTHGGPADLLGDCTSGTGADFGVFGGSATNPGSVTLGSTGHYLSKASPVDDPLANVAAPTAPPNIGNANPISSGTHGCTDPGGCIEYTPGLWDQLKPGKNSVIFDPGLYYVQGGGVDLKQTVGGGTNNNAMCVGCSADANTGTGMVIYDTVPAGTAAYPGNTNRPTGGFNIGTLASLALQGSTLTTTIAQGQSGCTTSGGCTVPAAPYYGVLFWEDRTANANSHTFGQGNGCFSLIGTIYITNTKAIMLADSTHHQSVTYNGTPCSTTINQGDIIVGQLSLVGTTSIKMKLVPYGYLNIRQVALIN